MARSNARHTNKNRVINVRAVDPLAGTDGAYVDRCISTLQNSHSQIRVLCNLQFQLNSSTTGASNYYSGLTVRNSDDFISMATQFDTFRVTAIKFEIYDINSVSGVFSVWSTFHDVLTSVPAYTFEQVTDGPDSKSISPGTGKEVFYWRAHGMPEMEFQSTTSPGGAPVYDFGGLRVYLNSAGGSFAKYQLIMKAVVDFRGRV